MNRIATCKGNTATVNMVLRPPTMVVTKTSKAQTRYMPVGGVNEEIR